LKGNDGRVYGSARPIGKHTFSAIPRKIAESLQLENSEKFTGQAYRGTALTIAADNGATEEQLRHISGHTSSVALHRYVSNSEKSRTNSARFLTIRDDNTCVDTTSSTTTSSSSSSSTTASIPSSTHHTYGTVTSIVNVYGGSYNVNNGQN